MATSLLKFAIHGNLVRTIQEEINNRSSRYYFFLGRSQPWTDTGYSWASEGYVSSGDIIYVEVTGTLKSTIFYYSAVNSGVLGTTPPDHTSGLAYNGTVNLQYLNISDNPEQVGSSYTYELQTRRDFVSLKEISPNDTAIVIPRYNWTRGYIYDQYDEYSESYNAFSGATSLDQATFYVVTDEFNVYKCLFNNNNSASLTKPSGTSLTPIIHTDEQDGYIWKFMYNIPLTLRNKFLTGGQIPVTNALLGQFYSNGSVVQAIINNPGDGYEANKTLPGSFYSDVYIDPVSNEPVYNLNRIICSNNMSGKLQVNKKIYISGDVRTVTAIQNLYRFTEALTVTASDDTTNRFTTAAINELVVGGAISFVSPVFGGVTAGTTYYVKEIFEEDNQFTIKATTSGSEVDLQTDTGNMIMMYNQQLYRTILVDEKIYIPPATPVGAKKINTYLKVLGDGYREENPYVITGFSPTATGSFGTGYSEETTTVEIAPPEVSVENGGIQATAVPVIVDGKIVDIELINPGYGYGVSSPTVTINSVTGGGASFVAVTRKTEAYIEPIISPTYVDPDTNRVYGELRGVEIINSGVGYTNATVEIERAYVDGVESTELPPEEYLVNGAILLNFDTGDLNSKQANQELLATRGSIDVIQVLNGGAGYSSATVEITGTGTDCTATPVITNGKISKIIVTNPGINYTQASVNIISSSGSGASARPIISPLGGHGKDAVSELGGRTIAFYNKLAGEKLQGLDYTGMYRQVGIIKNPKQFNDSNYFVNYFGNCCYRLELKLDDSQDINQVVAKLDQAKSVTVVSGTKSYRYRPVEVEPVGTSTVILLMSAIDYHIPTAGDTLTVSTYSLAVATVTTPTVDKYSGEILYIDNRNAFNYGSEQTVSISAQFKL